MSIDLKRRQKNEIELNIQDTKIPKLVESIDIPTITQDSFQYSSSILTPRTSTNYTSIEPYLFNEFNLNVPVFRTLPSVYSLLNFDEPIDNFQEEELNLTISRDNIEPDHAGNNTSEITNVSLEDFICKKNELNRILSENIQNISSIDQIFGKLCALNAHEPFSWSYIKSAIYLKNRPDEDVWRIIKLQLIEKEILLIENNLLYIQL